MSNVVRLVNGGTIQVRTGVLQGIGPQGPRGLVGPQGNDGPQGPVGDTGPMGQILQVGTRANMSTSATALAATNTVMAFGTVVYDDQAMATSSTVFTAPSDGDYCVNVYLAFAPEASGGTNSVTVTSSINGTVWGASCPGSATVTSYVSLTTVLRAVHGEVFQVVANSEVGGTVSGGSISIERVGSGPVGATGATGPAGPVGATGATGATGPAGTPGGTYSTYGGLHV